jgi:hypothetical protein
VKDNLNKGESGMMVPEGYFDSLYSRIITRIAMEEAKENNPFIVPAGYFESLDKNIEAGLSIETSDSKRETGFGVPDGYFEKLENKILEQTISRTHSHTHTQRERKSESGNTRVVKVISLFKNKAFLAAAASAAILLTIGIAVLNQETTIKPIENTFLSDKTKRAIIENPAGYNIDESLLIETLEGQICSDCPEKGNDEVTNYLLENDVDVQSLVEENK